MDKRFRALRVVAVVWKVLAWIVLIAGILAALFVVVIGAIQGRFGEPSMVLAMVPGIKMVTGLIPGVIAGVGLALGALIQFVLMYAFGEVIELGLALEQNTRETAYYLKGEGAMPAPPPPVSWETPLTEVGPES
jgi:hypothetical protein